MKGKRMNILYLSHLDGAFYAGPTYSVPKQIEAQSRIDHVFWYNATNTGRDEWKSLAFYHNLEEYPKKTIKDLPAPFCHPDVVIVESFYNMTGTKLLMELLRNNIPYIIIPRGELTKRAQNRKKLKKKIANLLVSKRFAKKAFAIHYLTAQEYSDSGDSWNNNHIIIPNGIDVPIEIKNKFCENGIQCLSIGRIEPYHKGLDLVIEACHRIRDDLIKANCKIDIYGPDTAHLVDKLKEQVRSYKLDDIIAFHDGIFGEEKKRVLLQSDVFLILSRFEGHPMALLEAMSYGLPCLVSTGSNMREEVEKYNAGWTADCSVEDIGNALLQMLHDAGQFQARGEHAHSLSQSYSWSNIAQHSHREYLKVKGYQ